MIYIIICLLSLFYSRGKPLLSFFVFFTKTILRFRTFSLRFHWSSKDYTKMITHLNREVITSEISCHLKWNLSGILIKSFESWLNINQISWVSQSI